MLRMRFWLLIYKTVTWSALGLLLSLMPLLGWMKPKFAKWFRMRFKPEPLSFPPRLWVHAVSMGEIKIALALLETQARTDDVLLTTSTQAGYHFLLEKAGKRNVRYLPWDVVYCYRKLFGGYRPPNLIVVETEIWPTLFGLVHGGGSRLVIVNARMSVRTLRWRKNPLFRDALSKVSLILARNTIDRARYLEFNVKPEQVLVTGNIKFDFKPKPLPADAFTAWLALPEPLFVFASISTDETTLLLPELKKILAADERVRVLWTPRHLEDLEKHLALLNDLKPVLRSKLGDQSGPFVLLDTFGELAGCFAFARLSLVGGSFNQRGGQNFLESLQTGTPVVIGPNAENFQREVADAIDAGALVQVARADEAASTMLGLLRAHEDLQAMSQNASDFLDRRRGAIARTVQVLVNLDVFEKPFAEVP